MIEIYTRWPEEEKDGNAYKYIIESFWELKYCFEIMSFQNDACEFIL
jgi:hypothetical protein